jgi:hypothetical protein
MDRARFESALTMDAYVASTVKHAEFWLAAWRVTQADPAMASRALKLQRQWRLVALSEDWCGDAINILPTVGRFAETAPGLELRVMPRDQNLDLMDAHQTRGTRSIPVIIVYDEDFQERGWWGPRPNELQAWFYDEGKALEKMERYRRLRTWYARDRGRSTLTELLVLLERLESEPGRTSTRVGAPR